LTSQTSNARPVPFEDVDTVFLDVGNTLISIDFDWVASELGTRNVACVAEALRRAEAGARLARLRRRLARLRRAAGEPPPLDLVRNRLAAVTALSLAPAHGHRA